MTTLDKGTADAAEDAEPWLPFGIEDHEVAAFTALWERIPSWFETSLWEWIARNLVAQNTARTPVIRTQLLRQAERALHVELPNLPAHQVGSTLGVLQDLYTSAPNPKAQLAFIDFLVSDLDEDHPYVVDLEQLLIEAGSGWRVGTRAGKPGLVKRLPTGVTVAAAAASQHPNAGKNLATAFESAFGLHPDPSKAYAFAVKAVEDATIAVVPTGKAEPTLGDVIRAVESGTWRLPHLREHQLAPSHDVLVSMLRLLWRGHHDRHGGPPAVGVPAVTQDEAESAVMLAVTLVGWFETGKVQQ